MKLAHAMVAVAGTATIALAATPGQAFAAVPSNDTIDGATVISAVPFSETIDTSQATTDAQDSAINAQCGAPATNGSVWYKVTATEAEYLVDVSQSNFSAGVIVATGTPGNLSIVTCGPGSVAFGADPGTAYYIMAFSDQSSVVGGQLTISVTVAPPPPALSLTVDPTATVTKQGTAIVTGTYTCSGQADFIEIFGSLDQPVGRVTINGNFDASVSDCDGLAHTWSAEAFASNGKFAGGKAASLSLIFGCNAVGCNFYETQQALKLRGGSGR